MKLDGYRIRTRLFTAASALFLFVLMGFVPIARAQVQIGTLGSPVTENFDSLSNNTVTATALPPPAHWSLLESGTSAAVDQKYIGGTGSSNAGNTYSFGAAAATERALGSLASGTLTSIFGASFQNTTNCAITSILISYTGEQWRAGGARTTVDSCDFQISTDATSLNTGTWTDVNALDLKSIILGGSAVALDGNAAANRAVIGSSVSISVAPGATFWIRWSDVNATGNDDGLSVDDFSLTAFGASLAATTTTVASDNNPASFGGKINFTAAVAPASATGSVEFFDGATSLGTTAVVAGSASISVTSLSAGSHLISAVYSGDCDNATSTSPALKQDVIGTSTPTTTALTASPSDSSNCGDKVTLTAAVAPDSATGTVMFFDGPDSIGVSAVSGGVAVLSVTGLSVGSHSFTAAYGGGGSYDPSVSSKIFHQVLANATSTALVADPAKSFYPESVNLTATVSAAGATGSVEFYDGASLIATSPVNGVGVATATAGGLSIGGHSLVAVYLGDACHDSSSTKIFHEVNLGQSNTSISASAAKVNCGEKVTLTATAVLDTTPAHAPGIALERARGASLANAPGTIQFYDGGNPVGSPVTVDSTGTATISLTGLTGGLHGFTAAYSGDKEKGPSGTDPIYVTVSPFPSSTVLAVSPNPAKGLGDLVTLRATVTPGDSVGTVEFFDGANSIGVAPLVGGVATLAMKFGAAGDHTITASFSGTDCLVDSGDDEVLTILGAPTISISDGFSVYEGDSGTRQIWFYVMLSSPLNQKAMVDWLTQDGTATLANSDYAAGFGTVSFEPGETLDSVAVNVNGDVKFEADETFDVVLANAVKATIDDGSGTGTIFNDDSEPTLSISDVSTTEGNSGTKQFKFVVTLSNPTGTAVTVNYQTSDGTATLANNDYIAANATLTIPAKSVSDTVRILVRGDTNREGDETFNLTLSGAVGATIVDGSAVGTILNDDAVPTIVHSGVRVAEGHPGLTNIVMTVSLSNPTEVPVTVNWATSDSTATLANNDYIPASGTVVIPAKASSATFTVQAVGDSTNEDWEVFHVDLSNPVNAALPSRPWLRVELSNDDTAPMVYIDDVTRFEGNAGTTAFVFRVRLSRATAVGTPTVNYTTQNGTATTGNNDYQATSGSVTFGVKEREQFITVLVNGDTQYESDETFTVKLSNPRFGMGPIGDGTAVGTILNDDPKLCPTVTAIAPDKNDLVVTGGIAKLAWSAVAGDNPVTTIDLYISRDNRATFQALALGEANDGTYLWNPVTGPGTNSGPVPVFNCWLKVVAHDAAGCAVSDSSGPFSIYDVVTEVLMAQFHAVAAGNGVEVRWEVAAGLQVTGVELERSRSTEGPWEVITAERRTEGATVVALDRTVATGTTYYYRLALSLRDGAQVRVGPLEVEAGTAITAFGLGKIAPNPSRGMTRIDYELPREASVRLSVLDVAGREVAVLASGNRGAGRYQAVWSGETDRGRAPAGLYFIRYQAPGVKLVRRLVLAR